MLALDQWIVFLAPNWAVKGGRHSAGAEYPSDDGRGTEPAGLFRAEQGAGGAHKQRRPRIIIGVRIVLPYGRLAC